GSTARITASGAVGMTATSHDTASATAQGGSGGAITGAGMFSDATVSGGTDASVAGRILSSAGLTLSATGNNTATADPLAVTVGIANGTGANSNATVDSGAAVQALVLAASPVIAGGGAVSVTAIGSDTANATSKGGGGSGIHIDAMLPTATL